MLHTVSRIRWWHSLGLIILLSGKVSEANAAQRVTYLYNSGWLIETPNELILIDYVPADNLHQMDSVLFKKIKRAVETNKKAYILITHEHSDHFYEPLLQWHHKITGLTTILGWDYSTTDKSILKLFNRDSLSVGSLKVASHPSTDAGSGFLVRLANLTFYHAGDHAAWSNDVTLKFTDELKFIGNLTGKIDMIFIPIARGKLGGCKSTESINEGTVLALQILKPRMVFPMHIQCDNLLPYQEFGNQVLKRFPAIVPKVPPANNYEFEFTTL